MPGRINDDDVRAVRERVDLARVVSSYTTLKRAGSRFRGLCPVHAEKTPSFFVDPARGLFHCFGCQAGGDVYSFLETVESLRFPEAVERTAALVGYALRYEELSPGQKRAVGRRTRLSECLAAAAGFYRDRFGGAEAEAARAYLESRGVPVSALRAFRIGWAPDAWDEAVKHLRAEGFDDDEVVDAGIASQGARGPVDRFRGRVIFPITDPTGPTGRDVIGFGGRLVPGRPLRTGPREGDPPKYINSPETDVYKKSRVLYGLEQARQAIQRSGEAVVVEGYTDVIAMHVAGRENVVATCGTALTEGHFVLLDRFADRVVLALDPDDAGFAAAERAREAAEASGLRNLSVLALPDGKDPADLAAGGADAVAAAMSTTMTAAEFQIRYLLRNSDVSTPEGQAAACRSVYPLLASMPDRGLRYRYIRDVVCPAVGLGVPHVEQEVDAYASRAPRTGRSTTSSAGVHHSDPSQNPLLTREANVLQVVMQDPDLLPSWRDDLDEAFFRAPSSVVLLRALKNHGSVHEALESLPSDDARQRARALLMRELMISPDTEQVERDLELLRGSSLKHREAFLRERVAAEPDPEAAAELFREIVKVRRLRTSLL